MQVFQELSRVPKHDPFSAEIVLYLPRECSICRGDIWQDFTSGVPGLTWCDACTDAEIEEEELRLEGVVSKKLTT